MKRSQAKGLNGQGVNTMKKQTIKTAETANIMTTTPKGFVALNAPKPNSVAMACQAIAAMAAKGQSVDGLTPLGHKANCKGGVIDATILSGKVHSLEQFTSALVNSGLSIVKSDIEKYGLTDTLNAVLAKRTVDHVQWCSNTLNNSHGGFGDRLEKVGLHAQRASIAENLVELASALQKQFSAHYSKLYKNR